MSVARKFALYRTCRKPITRAPVRRSGGSPLPCDAGGRHQSTAPITTNVGEKSEPQVEGVLVDGRGDVLAEGAVVLELQKQLPVLVEMDIGRCRLTAGNFHAMQ